MLLELVLMGNTDWFKHFVLWVMIGSQYRMMIGLVNFHDRYLESLCLLSRYSHGKRARGLVWSAHRRQSHTEAMLIALSEFESSYRYLTNKLDHEFIGYVNP